jgi:PhoH-like ATPase
VSDLYTGVRAIEVEDHELDGFFQKSHRSYDLKANEFIAIEGRTRTLYGRFDAASQKIKRVNIPEDIWGVKPRNDEQFLALAALMDDRIKLVTLSGGAGTGKTLMAIAAGLHKTTDEHVFKKLLVARPIFPMGKDLGFLPGDLSEKLNPWMQPIFDNLELLLGPKHGYEELMNQGILQVEPLTYIRGRSLPNIYFIVDEAQNLTPHEVKTILTRAGENTKIILTGDPDQIDNPYIDATNNGLTYVIEKFKEEAIAAHVQLVKGERSELATVASKLL